MAAPPERATAEFLAASANEKESWGAPGAGRGKGQETRGRHRARGRASGSTAPSDTPTACVGHRPSLCVPPASKAGSGAGRLVPLCPCRGKQDLEQASPRGEEAPGQNRGAARRGDERAGGESEMRPSSRCEGGERERRAPPPLPRSAVLPGARPQALLSPGDRRLGGMEARVRATSLKEAAGRSEGSSSKADREAVTTPAPGRQEVKISHPLKRDLLAAPGRVPGTQRWRRRGASPLTLLRSLR